MRACHELIRENAGAEALLENLLNFDSTNVIATSKFGFTGQIIIRYSVEVITFWSIEPKNAEARAVVKTQNPPARY